MKDRKKKILISSIAAALVTTNSSFAMLHVYGESGTLTDGAKALPKLKDGLTEGDATPVERSERAAPAEVKAILTKNASAEKGMQYKIYERKADGKPNEKKKITNATLKNVTDLIIDKSVTEITDNKFKDLKKLTKLTFNDASTSSKVTKIGKNAFKDTGITSVVFPKDLSVIEADAFANTSSLTTVDFTNSKNLNHIKERAFQNSGLTSVNLSPMDKGAKTVLVVETDAFKGNSNLTSLTLSTKMASIKATSFASTGLTSLHIPTNVTSLSKLAFQGTPLATITVDTGNKTYAVEDNVLYNKNKTSVYLYPEGRVKTELVLPDTVTNTPPDAFYAPKKLEKLVFGNSQVTISANAFKNAKKLTTLDLRKATVLKRVNANAFTGSALHTLILGERTGPLNIVESNPFKSTATKKQVFFLSDENLPLDTNTLKTLTKKYKNLKTASYNSWVFNTKLPKPNANIDYETMKLTGLDPSSSYSIQGTNYTTDTNGKLNLIKTWSEQSINIKKNPGELNESEVQQLVVEKLCTLTVDSVASLKKSGGTVTLTAPTKDDYTFKEWTANGVKLSNTKDKTITFEMPEKDVTLTTSFELTKKTLDTEETMTKPSEKVQPAPFPPVKDTSGAKDPATSGETAEELGNTEKEAEGKTPLVVNPAPTDTSEEESTDTRREDTNTEVPIDTEAPIVIPLPSAPLSPIVESDTSEKVADDSTKITETTDKADTVENTDVADEESENTIEDLDETTPTITDTESEEISDTKDTSVSPSATVPEEKEADKTVEPSTLPAPLPPVETPPAGTDTSVVPKDSFPVDESKVKPVPPTTPELPETSVEQETSSDKPKDTTDTSDSSEESASSETDLPVEPTEPATPADPNVLPPAPLSPVETPPTVPETPTAPAALVNPSKTNVVLDYNEMKITGLLPNARYKINGVVKTADAQGKIKIEKDWSSKTLDIVKLGTGTQADSKVKSLKVEKLFAVTVNGKEFNFTKEGATVKVKAESKKDYRFKGWKAKGVTLTNPQNEEVTFLMPNHDVELEPLYELLSNTNPVLPEVTPALPKYPLLPVLPEVKPDTSKVERTDVKATTKPLVNKPQTGDNSNLLLYTFMLLSAGLLAFVIKVKKAISDKR